MIFHYITLDLIAFRLVAPTSIHHIMTMMVFNHEVSRIPAVFEDEDGSLGNARSEVVVEVSVHAAIITYQADITRAFS